MNSILHFLVYMEDLQHRCIIMAQSEVVNLLTWSQKLRTVCSSPGSFVGPVGGPAPKHSHLLIQNCIAATYKITELLFFTVLTIPLKWNHIHNRLKLLSFTEASCASSSNCTINFYSFSSCLWCLCDWRTPKFIPIKNQKKPVTIATQPKLEPGTPRIWSSNDDHHAKYLSHISGSYK
jgi:hypothetical protein